MSNFRGKKLTLVCVIPSQNVSQSLSLILIECEIKNLGTPNSPLQNKKIRDHQWQNATNLHKSILW